MTEEPKDKRIPELPQTQASAKAVRGVTKAAVGSIPGIGAVLSEVVESIMPDPDKVEERRWAGEVNECLEGLHGRVDGIEDQLTGERTVTLEGPAAAVLQLMLQRCPDGRRNQRWTWEEARKELPELTERDFKDAAGELEHYGLVESLRSINGPVRLKLATAAYTAADRPVMGWNTRADAKHLAALSLEKDGGVLSKDLHEAVGWSLRRFNPALELVVQHVGHGRVSQSSGSEYVTGWFSPNDAERFALKQFART